MFSTWRHATCLCFVFHVGKGHAAILHFQPSSCHLPFASVPPPLLLLFGCCNESAAWSSVNKGAKISCSCIRELQKNSCHQLGPGGSVLHPRTTKSIPPMVNFRLGTLVLRLVPINYIYWAGTLWLWNEVVPENHDVFGYDPMLKTCPKKTSVLTGC